MSRMARHVQEQEDRDGYTKSLRRNVSCISQAWVASGRAELFVQADEPIRRMPFEPRIARRRGLLDDH